MSGSLHGFELKVERARRHLSDIDEAIQAFGKTALDGVDEHVDPDTGEHVLKLCPLRHPDPALSVVIGDFLHNARSALDHLAYQLVMFPTADGGPKTAESKIAFPLTDSSEAFETSKWKIRGAAPGVETIVERHQPYHASYPTLWLLQELNNWDKHRVLHLVENTLLEVGFRDLAWRPHASVPVGYLKLTQNSPGGRSDPGLTRIWTWASISARR